MSSEHSAQSQERFTVAKKHSKTSQDDEVPDKPKDFRKTIARLFIQLLTLPLALLLFFLALLFITSRQDSPQKSWHTMSREWPKLAIIKTHIQWLLRAIWRNSQPNYIRVK